MEVTKTVNVIDVQVIADMEPELSQLFPTEVTQIFADHIRKIVMQTYCEEDWKNAKVSMAFEDKKFHVVSGNHEIKFFIHCKDGTLESTQVIQINYLNEVNEVKEINKRTIGKAIIKYTGNEGAAMDSETEGLRKRLQAIIDYIQMNPSETIWTNAKFTVYDVKDNEFVFISGQGEHRFVVNEERGQIKVYDVNNKKRCCIL